MLLNPKSSPNDLLCVDRKRRYFVTPLPERNVKWKILPVDLLEVVVSANETRFTPAKTGVLRARPEMKRS